MSTSKPARSPRPFKREGNISRILAKQGRTLADAGLSDDVPADVPSRTSTRHGTSSSIPSQALAIGSSDCKVQPDSAQGVDEAPIASRRSPTKMKTARSTPSSPDPVLRSPLYSIHHLSEEPTAIPPSDEDASDSDSVWEFQRKARVDGIPKVGRSRAPPSPSPLRNESVIGALPNPEVEDYSVRSPRIQVLPHHTQTRFDDFDPNPEVRGRSGYGQPSSTLEIPTLGRHFGRSVSAEPPQSPDVPLQMDMALSLSAPSTSHVRTPNGIPAGIPIFDSSQVDEGTRKKKAKHKTLSEFLHKGSQMTSSSSSLLADLFR